MSFHNKIWEKFFMSKKRPVCEDLLPEKSVKLIDFPLDHNHVQYASVMNAELQAIFINLTQPSFVHAETNFLSYTGGHIHVRLVAW